MGAKRPLKRADALKTRGCGWMAKAERTRETWKLSNADGIKDLSNIDDKKIPENRRKNYCSLFFFFFSFIYCLVPLGKSYNNVYFFPPNWPESSPPSIFFFFLKKKKKKKILLKNLIFHSRKSKISKMYQIMHKLKLNF